MSGKSHSGVDRRLNVRILYEGVVIGQGRVRSLHANHAFLEIRDFPLGANSFLELIVDSADNTQVSTPVRVLKNRGEGLDVEFESIDIGIFARHMSNTAQGS